MSFSASGSSHNSLVSVLDSSLIAWWPLNNNGSNGLDLTDKSGSGNTLTNNSATFFTSGKLGAAAQLSGSSQYLRAGNSISLTTKGAMSAWVYADGFRVAANPRILGTSTNTYGQILVQDVTHKLAFFTESHNMITTNYVFPIDSAWHFVVFNWGSTGGDLYVDNASVWHLDTAVTLNSSSFIPEIGYGIATDWWTGKIDDVMYFNNTLTTDELTALYDGTAISHTSTLSAGSHTYKIHVQDTSGVITSSSTNTFTVSSDSTAPTITAISSDKANGSYSVGELIDIDVTFSEAVTSTGNVTVTLETGATDRTCTFAVSNAIAGTCSYTVQGGDTSADLEATISGTIADQSSNAMSNFTPATSLSVSKNLVIDTTAPSTPLANPAAGIYTSVQSVALEASGSTAIYYTTNGNAPTTGSALYGGAIPVNASLTIRALAVDGAGNESSILTATYTINLDTEDPIISNVSVDPDAQAAEVTWDTHEDASSQVEYGLISSFGSATVESDTSPRVTSHSVSLASLQSCAHYYFRVKSKDADNNQGISSQSIFKTSGCTISSVTEGNSDSIGVSGGAVSLDTEKGNATITAANNFYSESVTIQINQLDTDTTPDPPSGKNLINDNYFNLLAVTSSGIVVETFDSPVTFVIHYGASVENAYVESTLDVYKYSGGNWTQKNCTLDTSANTLTCALPGFSTYGVFGIGIGNSDEDDAGTRQADIRSWSAYRYDKLVEGRCKTKIRLEIKGRHFEKGAEVKIGNVDASFVRRESSRRIIAKFCLADLIEIKTKPARSVRVINPGAYPEKARKKIDVLKVPIHASLSEDTRRESGDNPETIQPTYTGDATPNTCSYVVQRGDNLWTIAKRVYGDARAYPLIIDANKVQYPAMVSGAVSPGEKLNFHCADEGKGDSGHASSEQSQEPASQPLIQPQETSEETSSKWWNPSHWW